MFGLSDKRMGSNVEADERSMFIVPLWVMEPIKQEACGLVFLHLSICYLWTISKPQLVCPDNFGDGIRMKKGRLLKP